MGGWLDTLFLFDPAGTTVMGGGPLAGGKKKSGSPTPLTDLYGAPAMAMLDREMPGYKRSYVNAGGAGGLHGRTYEQWLNDHMNLNRDTDDGFKFLQNFSTNYNPDGSISATNPDYLAHPEDYEEVHADQPIEETVFNKVRDDYLLPDIAKDKQRAIDAAAIIAQNKPVFDGAQQSLNSIYGGHFDGAKYLADNPDVAAGVKAGQAAGDTRSIDAMAESHYNQYGKNEGRAAPMTNSRLQDEQAYANADFKTRLGAINENDATIRNAVGTTQKSLQGNLANEIATRQSAIDTEMSALQGAVGVQADARRAALLAEKKELLEAQGQLGIVRVQGANTQATAANVAAQNEADKAVATMAGQGYIGGSSFDQAKQGQALMAGRMTAAGTLADANTLNAQEIAQILANTAGQKYGIGTDEAAGTKGVTDRGATDTAALSTYGATAGKDISDKADMSRLTLTQNTAAGTLAANNALADKQTNYFDNDFLRKLQAPTTSAQLATTQFGLNTTADNYAQSGLQRGLSNLGWFAAPTTSAQGTQTFQTTPVVDNSLAALGAAAGNAALTYAAYKKKTPTTPPPTPPPKDPYSGD